MFRVLFLLIVGISIGYFAGFKDGRQHDRTVIQRLVDRAGGAARSSVGNDIDAKMDKVGR
ncbi:MAG TPA: hypothetical protein VE967_04415 [Gemmatimonadaceae bacterium]|nr:hypothetical protein [Gemmatimonadaceae bacterium]